MSELANVYDSEVKELQRVLRELQDRTARSHNLESFDREINERCAEIGFRVDVKWHTTNVSGVFIPVVEVIGRITPIKSGEFDHDQMRHEVVNNLLDLPPEDAGVIKTPGDFVKHEPDSDH